MFYNTCLHNNYYRTRQHVLLICLDACPNTQCIYPRICEAALHRKEGRNTCTSFSVFVVPQDIMGISFTILEITLRPSPLILNIVKIFCTKRKKKREKNQTFLHLKFNSKICILFCSVSPRTTRAGWICCREYLHPCWLHRLKTHKRSVDCFTGALCGCNWPICKSVWKGHLIMLPEEMFPQRLELL